MNRQPPDLKEARLTQITPPGASSYEDELWHAETRLESDERILNQSIGVQNYRLRWFFGAIAALAPLIILAFVGRIIWFDPEKIKSIGNFAGSAFVAAPLLAFLTIYGLLIQGIFNGRGESSREKHLEAKMIRSSISLEPDSDEHERFVAKKFENFIRDMVGKANIATHYAHKEIPRLSDMIATSVYGIHSISRLEAIRKDLGNGKYGDLWNQGQSEKSMILALGQFIQFRRHEQNYRKQHELERKIQNQQDRGQNYRLRWILGTLATITPIIIASFLIAVVWYKPDAFEKIGSYAGAAFVSATLLAFVVVYGFLIRGIFNGRKQDDKYTVTELWNFIKRNISVELNDPG